MLRDIKKKIAINRVKKSSAPNLNALDADTDSNGSGGGGGFTRKYSQKNLGSSKRFSRMVSFCV